MSIRPLSFVSGALAAAGLLIGKSAVRGAGASASIWDFLLSAGTGVTGHGIRTAPVRLS